jgi:hypothetical protein
VWHYPEASRREPPYSEFDPVVVVRTAGAVMVGMTGRVGPIHEDAATAPQDEHVGVGGTTPFHTVGTVTSPPHWEQVPMVRWS